MKLLLDEHLAPTLAASLLTQGIDAVALARWRGGRVLGAPDEDLLREAMVEGRVLVTYDLRTMPPLLRRWAERGLPHGGVILVDGHTVPPNDIKGLQRALATLVHDEGETPWIDRVLYLRVAPSDLD